MKPKVTFILAVETASLDLINAEDFIERSLPPPLARTGGGHLFKQIHAKDPYIGAKLKLGKTEYKFEEIR